MALPNMRGGAAKPLIPFIAAVAAIGLGAFVWSQIQQVKQLEQRLQQAQQQIGQLESLNQELSQKLTALEGQRQALDERVAELRRQLNTTSESLEHARDNLDELQSRYEQLSEARNRLEAQLASVTGERDEGRRQEARLKEENAELERAAIHLRERLALLERDYRQAADQVAALQAAPHRGVSLISPAPAANVVGPTSTQERTNPSVSQGTVELPPIVVRKDQAGMSLPVRGRVVEVNAPHHFIVVDKGTLDGVHVGMAFDIVRGLATVGRAAVVRVRPKLAACDIVRAKSPGPIQVGDEVVQLSSGTR